MAKSGSVHKIMFQSAAESWRYMYSQYQAMDNMRPWMMEEVDASHKDDSLL